MRKSDSSSHLRTHHHHTDIFGAKPTVHPLAQFEGEDPYVADPFKAKMEQDYVAYQELLSKSRNNKQTYEQRWCEQKQQMGPKTQVNQNASFQLNYHRLKKAQQMSSLVFGGEEPKMPNFRKPEEDIPPRPMTAKAGHGRVSTLKREVDSTNAELKSIGNGSNLFQLCERQQQPIRESQIQSRVEPLISHKQAWTDSVPQGWKLDEGADYHKRRYYQNMKSTMDNHKHYDSPLRVDPKEQVLAVSDILNEEDIKRPEFKPPVKVQKEKPKEVKKAGKGEKAKVEPRNMKSAEGPRGGKAGGKKQEKQFEIEVQEGWQKINLQLLATILGPIKLVDLRQGDKIRGRLKVQAKPEQLLQVLKKFKREGIRAVRG